MFFLNRLSDCQVRHPAASRALARLAKNELKQRLLLLLSSLTSLPHRYQLLPWHLCGIKNKWVTIENRRVARSGRDLMGCVSTKRPQMFCLCLELKSELVESVLKSSHKVLVKAAEVGMNKLLTSCYCTSVDLWWLLLQVELFDLCCCLHQYTVKVDNVWEGNVMKYLGFRISTFVNIEIT